jgi:NAD+ kinase
MGIRRISIVKRKDYPQVSRIEENFEIRDKGEICIAIGGDGTFLEAARKFDIPILHIRGEEKESLGFHADVTLKEVDGIIRELQSDMYSIKEYPKLQITHKSGITDVVNDAILFRGNPKSIHCKIYNYEEKRKRALIYPSDIKGDGVIFSRQIGSTAYNFSAHGPIIYGVDVIVITPISANFKFSIISNKDFSVKVTKNIGSLQCDGVEVDRLSKEDVFTVNRSKKVVKVIKLKKVEGFSEKLARLLKF